MNEKTLFPLIAGLITLIGILACGGDGGTSKYTVGGTVSGLSGNLTLQCNGTNDLVVTEDGTFTFGTPLKKGAAYEVTIAGQPYRQICGITANGSGTVPDSDITSVQVECITADVITRVSVASDGTEGNISAGFRTSISEDGRFVALESGATNLVTGDTNGHDDIFVHDRLTGETTRVSVASDGTEANSSSLHPSISGDGRYIAFHSSATNLVAGDTNGRDDVFVHDSHTGETKRLSVAYDGSEANSYSLYPSISGDGRYVAFVSWASNLVEGDTNGWNDIFVTDRPTGEITRVSVASDGTEANESSTTPSISGDGRYVAFQSIADNLVAGISFTGGNDIFVHDRLTGQTNLVNVTSKGVEGNNISLSPSISGNGRLVAFYSNSTNLVAGDTNGTWDIFVHDQLTGETTRVSVASDGTEADYSSHSPSVSGDGRCVAFGSWATNFEAGDNNLSRDAFVHDRLTGETKRVSLASDGTEANNNAGYKTSISEDCRYVAFDSGASNLVAGDTNGLDDIFVTPIQ